MSTRLGLVLGGRLWRHPDFLKLWLGQLLPAVGGQAVQIALPTAAIVLLHAGPLQMGILTGLRFLPFLLLGLPAGVLVDRLPRRPVMAATDVVSVLATASVPVAAALGVLRLEHLYLVVFLNGTAALFFDVAYQSYLLRLVGKDGLVEGNAKLTANFSVAGFVGPALGGALIQAVGAARALAAGSVGWALSFLALLAIGLRETASAAAPARRHFLAELWEGLRYTLGEAVLRQIVLCAAVHNVGSIMVTTVYLLFAYHRLGLPPFLVGLTFAAAGVTSLVGSSLSGAVKRRLGAGRALFWTQALTGVSFLLMPLAVFGAGALVLALAQALLSFQRSIFNVIQVSFRQGVTPDHLQGRMHATIRTVIWGVYPLGALLGGVAGERLGLVTAILVGGSLCLLAAGFLLARPVRSLSSV